MKLRHIGALATVAVVAFASTGCNLVGGGKTINFAIELPQQGSEKAASDPIINGIKLAVKDAGGEVGGWKIEIPNSVIKDDALNGVHDPQTGAANMTQLVAIPEVIGVI